MTEHTQSVAEIRPDDHPPKTRQLLRILPARDPQEDPVDHQQTIYAPFHTPYCDGS